MQRISLIVLAMVATGCSTDPDLSVPPKVRMVDLGDLPELQVDLRVTSPRYGALHRTVFAALLYQSGSISRLLYDSDGLWYCPVVDAPLRIAGLEARFGSSVATMAGGYVCTVLEALIELPDDLDIPASTIEFGDRTRSFVADVGNAIALRTAVSDTPLRAHQSTTLRWSPASDLTRYPEVSVFLSMAHTSGTVDSADVVRGSDTLRLTLPDVEAGVGRLEISFTGAPTTPCGDGCAARIESGVTLEVEVAR